MNLDDVERWMDGYVRAWASNDPEDIGALVTDDARYLNEPWMEPLVGRDAIVADWLERKDEPGQYSFRYEPMAIAGNLAFVRGWTHYFEDPPVSYHNLFVVRLADDGRAEEFTEWFVKERSIE